jgi:recombination protein RecA
MSSAATLRSQIEAALADRIPSVLTPAMKTIREVMPTGIAAIDAVLDGGFPVGAVTEMIGAECSGRTALALSFLAQVTKAERVCAWIDVSNALSPESAAATGIDLRRLLGVRCGVQSAGQPASPSQGDFALPEKYLAPAAAKRGAARWRLRPASSD